MTASRCSRKFLLRRICEGQTRPFDCQDIFLLQPYGLTRNEVEQELSRADYLVIVRHPESHKRTLYEYKRECRSFGPVSYAIYPRKCAQCKRSIVPGEPIYNPRNLRTGSRRSACLCREDGLKMIAQEVERLMLME
jgi:hypothetical protein